MDALIPNPKIRLNPFLFPSETDLRFVLLIVVLFAESLFTYSYLQGLLFQESQTEGMLECNRISGFTTSVNNFDLSILYQPNLAKIQEGADWANSTNESSRIFQDCMRPWDLSRAFWGLGGCILLAGVAFVIYWTTPSRKIRHEKYEIIPVEDAKEILEQLNALSDEAGVSPRPKFLWMPTNTSHSGLAFGRWGQYYVVINGGLVTDYYAAPASFRAIVLHELAHLRNADIDKTYLTIASWQAFIFVVLIPQLLVVFWQPFMNVFYGVPDLKVFLNNLIYASIFAVDAFVLFGLVYLTRNAILRTREYYADVRASIWDTVGGGLEKAIQALSGDSKKPELLRVHPDPKKRIYLLSNTMPLFEIGFIDAFLIGIAAMVGTQEFRDLFLLLMPFFTQEQIVAGLLTGLLYAVILIGILGTLVWRAVFCNLIIRRKTKRTLWWKIGLGLGLGSIVGVSVSFTNSITAFYGILSVILANLVNILVGCFLFVSFSLFLGWMAENAEVWIPASPAPEKMRKFFVSFSALSTIALILWLGWTFTAWSPGNAFITAVGFIGGLVLAMSNPLMIFFFVLLWLGPLAVSFWPKLSRDSDWRWAFLSHPLSVAMPVNQLSPLRALSVGAICGVLYCIFNFLMRILAYLALPTSTTGTDEYKLWVFGGSIFLAVVMQVLILIIVISWTKDLKIYHGMMAAFIGGCTMAVGYSVITVMLGGNFVILLDVFPWMLNIGMLVTLPIILFVNLTSARTNR